jgi:phenylacetate-coenzyme A ligase PaaK-like adenylate-forming protein
VNKINQEEVFTIQDEASFKASALKVFRYQAESCKVYKSFIEHMNIQPDKIDELEHIPFLPVEFFKSHQIVTDHAAPVEIVFSSSGTTGMVSSKHLVTNVSWYEKSFRLGFEKFYKPIQSYAILALLPSYLEREGSSLIYMVKDMIQQSDHPSSGFFLDNFQALYQQLKQLKEQQQATILIGVTFALLDFLEQYQLCFPELIIMETGGMKGRRKEMIREQLHEQLCKGFGVQSIHSEYGMTELLSQAYSLGEGIFQCPQWMQILIRDTNDPLTLLAEGKTGGINVIDLANINSCSFIATQDLGRKIDRQRFEVLGRFDNSDIRGCNLLVS